MHLLLYHKIKQVFRIILLTNLFRYTIQCVDLIIGVLEANNNKWVPSISWTRMFLKRIGLSYRRGTRDQRKVPETIESIKSLFYKRFIHADPSNIIVPTGKRELTPFLCKWLHETYHELKKEDAIKSIKKAWILTG